MIMAAFWLVLAVILLAALPAYPAILAGLVAALLLWAVREARPRAL